MIDIQSMIYVAYAVSQDRTGRLDDRGQIELDRPLPLREPDVHYADTPLPPRGETEKKDSLGQGGAPEHDSSRGEVAGPGARPPLPVRELAAIAAESGIAEETLAGWVTAVERKKQAVFYGPPGTGKTYIAGQIAAHLAGGANGFIDLVQFHPAYDYPDFVEGIRPVSSPDGGLSYENKPGVFLDFCRRAAGRSGRCVLIIDEINRANLSRVFGELMYLLEYREQTVNLASGRAFQIPENVRIIGTMNTADRSIALIDHALRRRFAFIPLRPDFDLLHRWHKRHSGLDLTGLIDLLADLNQAIGDPDVAVGISYFLERNLPELLPDIWQLEIEPYLEELFFNKREMLERFRWDKIKTRVVPSRPNHND